MTNQELIKQFGQPRANLVTVKLPYPMRLAWNLAQTSTKAQIHKDYAESFLAAFTELLEVFGYEKIVELRLDIWGGTIRWGSDFMRGSDSKFSTHIFGIAFDLDPDNNKLAWKPAKATFAKTEYDEFHEIMKKHGWYSLGKEKGYDYMHYQAIKP